MLYKIRFISIDNACFNLFNMPTILEPLFDTFQCFFPIHVLSKVSPKNINSSTRSMLILLMLSEKVCLTLFGISKVIYFY